MGRLLTNITSSDTTVPLHIWVMISHDTLEWGMSHNMLGPMVPFVNFSCPNVYPRYLSLSPRIHCVHIHICINRIQNVLSHTKLAKNTIRCVQL